MENQQRHENPDAAAVVVQSVPESVHPAAEAVSELTPVAQAVVEAAPPQRAAVILFWLEDGVPMSHGFGSKELGEALKLAEVQRKRRAAGERISHVCISSEHEDSVGLPGVSDKLPEGYDWSKQDRAGKTRRR